MANFKSLQKKEKKAAQTAKTAKKKKRPGPRETTASSQRQPLKTKGG